LALALANLGTVASSVALGEFGSNPAWAALFALVTFPFSAWFMSKAAKRQGRSALLYGLASLLPLFAILAFIALYNHEVATRLRKQ
jgi:bacteriorhodopsin